MNAKTKTLTLALSIVTIAAIGITSAIAKPKDEKPIAELPKCPVMDEPVDFRVSTMTDEGPVYFCCKMCIEKFNEKPKKYEDKVKTQRKALEKREKVQVTCPLSGEPIDKNVFTGKDNDRVYFCCEKCKAKYEESPKKYEAKLAASYTYQTRCPIMGGEIDPGSHLELAGGGTIYFCCPGCDKKLLDDPDKYVENLKKQGYGYKAKDIKKAPKEEKDK